MIKAISSTKYGGLLLATFKGIALIGIVGLLCLQFREHFVDSGPHISWGIFVTVLGGALGGAGGYAGMLCRREFEKIKQRS